jgi:hypothetical protein
MSFLVEQKAKHSNGVIWRLDTFFLKMNQGATLLLRFLSWRLDTFLNLKVPSNDTPA